MRWSTSARSLPWTIHINRFLAHIRWAVRCRKLKKLQKKKGLFDKREEIKRRAYLIRQSKNPDLETNDWEDVYEHKKDLFDKDSYFNVQETEAAISESDQTILQSF